MLNFISLINQVFYINFVIFIGKIDLENCPPGTIINDPNLCKANEFYMIS